MNQTVNAPTAPQIEYVRNLQRHLTLSNALLDSHCVARFGWPFRELERAAVSLLIDELKSWQAIPAQLLREAGQLDLLGFGS